MIRTRRCQRLSTAKGTVFDTAGTDPHRPTRKHMVGRPCGVRVWADLGYRLGFAISIGSTMSCTNGARPASPKIGSLGICGFRGLSAISLPPLRLQERHHVPQALVLLPQP
jgi:hypothetical protein